ncbi:MAG: rhomboid family intramembrane serine protease [Wenzhouxiangellaceae bacterium]
MTLVFSMDDGRRRPSWPWVCLFLVVINLLVTAYLSLLDDGDRLGMIQLWGLVPADLVQVLQAGWRYWLSLDLLTLFTTLLLHASWLHLLGNMAYLWVFGMPLERRFGRWLLLLAFFGLGGLANLFLVLENGRSQTPVIGASAGVSALIGSYLGLLPGHRLGLYIPLGFYIQFARVPALIVIGSWFLLQVIYTISGPVTGAVAWRVHVTGFLSGLIVALILRRTLRHQL